MQIFRKHLVDCITMFLYSNLPTSVEQIHVVQILSHKQIADSELYQIHKLNIASIRLKFGLSSIQYVHGIPNDLLLGRFQLNDFDCRHQCDHIPSQMFCGKH